MPAWIITAVVLLVILWLTLAPKPLGEEEIPLFPGADKVAHGLMFAGLTFAALIDWKRGRDFRTVRWPVCLSAAVAASCIGVVIEFAQRAMNMGRSFDCMDMVADAAGAFAVAAVWILAERHLKIRKEAAHMQERK